MTAVVEAATGVVATLNVVEVAPAGTIIVDGAVAVGLLDVTAMTAPPAGAAMLIVTVAVEALLPATVEGESVNPVGTGMLSTFFANPEKMSGPQPVTISHPGPALEVCPFGKVPFDPDVMSVKTVGSPLNEYNKS
jgi:hypothetical protein